MDDGLAEVRALLPGTPVEVVDRLGGSTRSHVRRVRAGERTVIVKEFTGAGDGWARECAALSVLPPEVPAPRLVARGAKPPIVVMSDLGPGRNVADLLLGADRAAAVDGVLAWAAAVGSLHRHTAGLRHQFQQALAGLPESLVATKLDDACDAIALHGAELGVAVPVAAVDELRSLGVRLGSDGPAALTPSDTCPDNNVRTGAGLALIDFEGAQWRHIAWDVAYLTVPWPSCWCSWRIPDELAEPAIEAYLSAYGPAYPGFRRDVEAATVGWAFESMSWLLPRALTEEVPPAMPAPTRRAMILHRLRQAATSAELPALADLAAGFHTALTDRWGEVPLRFAPAFR